MFYIKVNGQKKEITARNIYTLCPECGKEIQVDLTELIQPGEFDLEASRVLCGKCSRSKHNMGEADKI